LVYIINDIINDIMIGIPNTITVQSIIPT